MRPEKISNLRLYNRIQLQNEPFLQNLLEPDDFFRLKKKIENGDLIGVDSWYDTSYLNGTIKTMGGDTLVELDLLPGETFKLDKDSSYLVELLEPGDDDYEKPNPPQAPKPPKYPSFVKPDNTLMLKMLSDVILSSTSRTTTNRAELIKALIEDKVTEDEVRQSFDSQEAYDLFKDILQDLEKEEAKRLGTTLSSVPTTPTSTPPVKRGRKKKEPALPEPTQIPTTDTSVFEDEDELSSLLDEFLT